MFEGAKDYLFSVAARKATTKIVECVLTWLASGVVQGYLTQAGVHYDPVMLRAELTGALMTGVSLGKDYLRLKGYNL